MKHEALLRETVRLEEVCLVTCYHVVFVSIELRFACDEFLFSTDFVRYHFIVEVCFMLS